MTTTELIDARYVRTTKVALLIATLVAALVLIGQNTEVVEFSLLFWTVTMSRIILLAVAIAIGFVGGFVTAVLLRT